MQTALKLRWHNLDPSDALAEEVRGEVERLERFSHRITGCTVTLEAPGHHHRHAGAQYRVRIELSVPRGKLVVGRNPTQSKAHGDLYAAIKAAFRAAQRQLEDHDTRLDAKVKTHAATSVATVARILRGEGYGFLATPDGREVYFHEHSVVGGAFADLTPGAEVRFVEAAGDEGPQASTVTPLRAGRGAGAPGRRELLPAVDLAGTPLAVLLERWPAQRDVEVRALEAEEEGALLWAAEEIGSPEGGRQAPAGTRSLTLRLVDGRGVWRYVPAERALVLEAPGDARARLGAALAPGAAAASAVVAVTATPEVLAERYGRRGERYATLEAGQAAQNVVLMARALGLAAAPVAAFDDEAVRDALGLGAEEAPLQLVPVRAAAAR